VVEAAEAGPGEAGAACSHSMHFVLGWQMGSKGFGLLAVAKTKAIGLNRSGSDRIPPSTAPSTAKLLHCPDAHVSAVPSQSQLRSDFLVRNKLEASFSAAVS